MGPTAACMSADKPGHRQPTDHRLRCPIQRVVLKLPGLASDLLRAQLLPPGQSKAVGVGRLLKQLDVQPAEMMAVGDSESDIEILKMAGEPCGPRTLHAIAPRAHH